MTTEDDFHRALDAHPDDWQTRLVFADWLQERGDPRAEGYRVLGLMRLHPYDYETRTLAQYGVLQGWQWWNDDNDQVETPELARHRVPNGVSALIVSHNLPTRREAEDAVAIAFARLPPERRAELLATPLAGRGAE